VSGTESFYFLIHVGKSRCPFGPSTNVLARGVEEVQAAVDLCHRICLRLVADAPFFILMLGVALHLTTAFPSISSFSVSTPIILLFGY
jgi:hypothetical protein